MSTPVYANAYRDATFVARRTAVALWTAFRPHRPVSTGLGISLALHLAAFVVVGSAMYTSGEDQRDVPELSVQLVTREGSNEEEYREAALPVPVPEPQPDEVIDDAGSRQQSLDAPSIDDTAPRPLEPDSSVVEQASLDALAAGIGSVLTTTAPAEDQVVFAPEPAVTVTPDEIAPREQKMLERQVQKLAQELLAADRRNTELTWQEDGRQYQARLVRHAASDSTGIEQVVAEVMTDRDGKRMKTRLSLKRLAFSHFTQLVNIWDRNIQLHDDVVDGRFHSNTEFSFATNKQAAPRFFGKVTTAAATLTYDGTRPRNKDMFQGGYETRTQRVLLPRAMPDVVNGGSEADRRVFTNDTRIIFNADGSYVWRDASGEGELHREPASQQARYLIGEKGAKLYVRGTVSGLFTVYTPNDIEIEDDLVYARDPRQTMMSRDFLALIAGRDVTIAAPEVTGPGDLTVHAAIYARRQFNVSLANRGRSGDATLVVYGSLTAGSLSESEPRYATNVDYDKRFEYLRPAGFPMTRRYEVESWDEGWEEMSASEASTGLVQAQ